MLWGRGWVIGLGGIEDQVVYGQWRLPPSDVPDPLGDLYPCRDTEGGSVLGRCELAKLGEGAPVAAYERQLLGTKGRLPYWWPSPIPLCEVAPRGGWRERGRVCQGYSAFLGWQMPSGFQPGGRLQELRFRRGGDRGRGRESQSTAESQSECTECLSWVAQP